MGRPIALVTGAGGELGRVLVPELERTGFDVVALDLAALPQALAARCRETVQMNILDLPAMQLLVRRHPPSIVFHLAALLSAHSERDPDLAHHVNVDGTIALLKLCWRFDPGPVRFLFPSSIAVYGLPDAKVKADQGALAEWQWTTPRGMYGCNKLYCELIGAYLARRDPGTGRGLDFRAIRFPGLISSETLPTGGTTDYAPEMIHAAAAGRAYRCWVREDSRLPFMTMPDAVEALLKLAHADAASLSTRVYNIRGFSCSAGEIRDAVRRHFPAAEVEFEPLADKQAIVDSWPADIDDARARRDWGLAPRHGLTEALRDYLVPALVKGR
jgi:threonine 3-dehydrogenase